MAIHCDDLNLLYLCTEKTGSTSVSNALLDQLGGRWLPADHIWDGEEIVVDHKHSSLGDLVQHGLLDEAGIRSMHVAITVRNPFAWIASGYRYRRKVLRQRRDLGDATPDWIVSRHDDLVRADDDFDSYVRGECELRGGSMVHRYLDGFRDHPDLTYMRLESIDDDFNRLITALGVGWRITIPHDNTTAGVGYRDMFGDESRSLVEDAFADDLDRFGYRF